MKKPSSDGSRRRASTPAGGATEGAFRYSAAATWEEDISLLRASLRDLDLGRAGDFRSYLHSHPEYLREAVRRIRVVDVNDAAIGLYEAQSKDDLLGPLEKTLDLSDPAVLPAFEEMIVAIAEGRSRFEGEGIARSTRGRRFDVSVAAHIPADNDPYPYMVVTVVDVSRLKAAEERVHRLMRMYSVLSEIGERIVRVRDRETLFWDTCRAAVERGELRMAWIGVVDESSGQVVPAAWAGETGSYLNDIMVSIEDNPQGHGPTGQAIRSHHVVVCADILSDPSMAHWRESAERNGFRSSASVSFLDGSGLRGALSVYSPLPDSFGQEEVDLLAQIGDDLSFALRSLLDERARRRAEEALGYERELLRTLIDNIPDGIYAKDTQYRKTLVNPADIDHCGKTSAEEVLGRTDFELFDTELAEGFYRDDRSVIEHGIPIVNREERFIDRHGRSRWLLTSKLPLRDQNGLIIGLVGVGRDVTEYRENEEHIRRQAKLLDVASDAIVVRDVENHIRYWNQGAARCFGWSADEALGADADALVPAESPEVIRHALEAVRSKGEWSGDVRLTTKSGEVIWTETRWSLVTNAVGDDDGVLTVTTDVTEQRTIQERLYRAQRLESLGTLASGIAHDLNNVLTPILLGIDSLVVSPNGASSTKILEVMRASARRGADIIAQVLGFARGDNVERARIEMERIVEEVANIARETFPKGIRVDVETGEDLWSVIGNPTLLHQMVLNLCVNARDAMPSGGRILISLSNAELDESYSRLHVDARPGRYVLVCVEDEGTGMPPEVVERIFDPFFTTKGVGEGTGLGLSTTLSIVKAHHGFLNVYSEVGKGSSFKIFIPAVEANRAVQETAPLEETTPAGREQVLVIDDETAVREITRQMLESQGYTVIAAADGEEGVGVFKANRGQLSLVLVDMLMPKLDGISVIRAIRKLDEEVKIILMSGLMSSEQADGLKQLGRIGFLAKPYTASTLLGAVSAALSGR